MHGKLVYAPMVFFLKQYQAVEINQYLVTRSHGDTGGKRAINPGL
jgi:hypothetical protein